MAEASRGIDMSASTISNTSLITQTRRRARALSFPLVPVDLYQSAYSYASSTSINSYHYSNGNSPARADSASSIYSFGSGNLHWRYPSANSGLAGSSIMGSRESFSDDNDGSYDDDDTSSTSSYAGSDADTDPDEDVSSEEENGQSSNSESEDDSDDGNFDPSAYVSDKILQAFDAMLLDRAVVVQAQSSGLLNSKSRELQQMQELSTKRIYETRASFVEGLRTLREVQKDLKWVQRHVDSLKKKVSSKYPAEYSKARELIPEIIEPEDD
ncbi:hypothetical protein BZA70DRAFT_271834 [Myxozyma melibiosi]|uniref:Biogenesis of lysosome-related organelles complex 1 subunit KXD1 n=1 Tax=Myxozyma melibiosi TaxID=54550 RepID=A0ABR1FCR0_9ASCO